MSLKRKADPAKDDPQKKPKSDFFAPRTAVKTGPLFSFVAKAPETIRLTTWNVNGIQSIFKEEQKRSKLTKYLDAEDPDILILTETRYSQGTPNFQSLRNKFKYQYWGNDVRAGQAGMAILSKIEPVAIKTGLPTWTPSPSETKGRYIELEFQTFFIVGTYVPNSGDKFKFMDKKQKWNASFSKHLKDLDSKKPVIWAGDFNCIPTKKDIDSKALKHWDQISGLSSIERDEFNAILNPPDNSSGRFADAWRHLHPEAQEFTHASETFGAWRLDSFILSERILGKALMCSIRHEMKELKLSDHWPVTLDFASEP